MVSAIPAAPGNRPLPGAWRCRAPRALLYAPDTVPLSGGLICPANASLARSAQATATTLSRSSEGSTPRWHSRLSRSAWAQYATCRPCAKRPMSTPATTLLGRSARCSTIHPVRPTHAQPRDNRIHSGTLLHDGPPRVRDGGAKQARGLLDALPIQAARARRGGIGSATARRKHGVGDAAIAGVARLVHQPAYHGCVVPCRPLSAVSCHPVYGPAWSATRPMAVGQSHRYALCCKLMRLLEGYVTQQIGRAAPPVIAGWALP